MTSAARPDFELRHILVVEDDALVSETIVAMLEEHFDTVVVASVAAALAYLGGSAAGSDPDGVALQGKPALILLDCLLPGGGLATLLRAADQREIPTVLISGDPAQATLIDAARRFLPKPFSQGDLLRAVHATCG